MTEKKDKKASRKLPVVGGTRNYSPEAILGKDGPLAKSLPDYQVRKSQILLATKMQEAFNEKKHLVAEAQTGTGKSFAGLLAAFETSDRTRTPVVISTHTIALQEQLCEKDVPFLIDKLGLKNVNVTLAKGRGNYVSIRRARIAIQEKHKGYKKFAEWLESTDDGTKSSLPSKPDIGLWMRSRSDTDQCLGEECETFEKCFYQKTRRKLGESHVIITNHNLVLLDRQMKANGMKGVLPEYHYLILDEAHEVEHVARQVLTFEFKQKDLINTLYELWNDKGTGFLNGAIAGTTKTLRESMAAKAAPNPKARVTLATVDAIKNILDQSEDFFKKVAEYIGSSSIKRFTQRKAIKTDIYTGFQTLLGCLKELGEHIQEKNKKAAIEYVAKRCTEMALGIDNILNLPNVEGKDYPDVVAWAASRTYNKTKYYSVVCAPIFLKPLLKRLLFTPLHSVALMSATLATAGRNPFRMLESTLGVPDPMRLRLPAVFDYAKQAKIIVIEDMPEQSSPKYVDELSGQVRKYAKAINGGAFVLFTSFKVMNEVYEKVKTNLEMSGYKLFCQGKELTRKQMIAEFKKTNKGILFGVSSFWTGVDIPGKALQKLIITKLPFPAPNDPLMQAQEEIYKKFDRNFFMERSIPMTSIMLKQGFGRLIRKSTDKGFVVILDSRVVTKKYGPMLLNALPSDCPVLKGRRDSRI